MRIMPTVPRSGHSVVGRRRLRGLHHRIAHRHGVAQQAAKDQQQDNEQREKATHEGYGHRPSVLVPWSAGNTSRAQRATDQVFANLACRQNVSK
jgi:hypothetical protein